MSDDTATDLIDTDAPTEGSTLRPSQLRRVAALHEARKVLENKAGLFVGSKMGEGFGVGDLTYVAGWIIDGPVPDERDTAEYVRAIPARPYPNEADTFNNPTQERYDDAATADLYAARSDANDGI